VALALPRATALGAARGGALFFAVHWGVALLWILQAGLRVGAWTVAAWLALVATLALLGAVFGRLLHHLAGAAGLPLPLALTLAWMSVEVGRGFLLGPLDFPWMGIALPLTAHPTLIQGAAWVGEVGVATGVVAVNGVVATAFMRRDVAGGEARTPALRALLAVALVLVGVHVGGTVRMERASILPVATLVAVQPAVPLEAKRGAAALPVSVAAVERLLPEVVAEVQRSGADGAVLPETALPAPVAEVESLLRGWARRVGVPLVVGVEGRLEGRRSNAVLVADTGAAASWPRAHKVRLVPGVEWSPLSDEGWARGGEAGLLEVERAGPGGAVTLAPLVCIESAGPRPALGQVARGADLLVNVTNDAWLAEAPIRSRSPAFHQHPAHLAFRSVETGRGALRVGNNGLSEAVDPLGRRRRLLAPHRPGAASARLHRLPGRTPFVVVGWVLPWLLLASAAAAALRPLVESATSPSGLRPTGGRADGVGR
jgi:apolipoprotein N-acyltransferase